MAAPTMTVLVGMIASGKSTYARAQAKQGAVIVSDDALASGLFGSYAPNRELALQRRIQESIAATALRLGKCVVVDSARSLSRRERKRWLLLAERTGAECAAAVFPLADPQEHAARRAAHDSRGVTLRQWQRIAKYHAMIYDPVEMAEGFARVYSVE